jgi:hypothetical protein
MSCAICSHTWADWEKRGRQAGFRAQKPKCLKARETQSFSNDPLSVLNSGSFLTRGDRLRGCGRRLHECGTCLQTCGRPLQGRGRCLQACGRLLQGCGRCLTSCGERLQPCGTSLQTCRTCLPTCGRSLQGCGRCLQVCGRCLQILRAALSPTSASNRCSTLTLNILLQTRYLTTALGDQEIVILSEAARNEPRSRRIPSKANWTTTPSNWCGILGEYLNRLSGDF